MFKNLIFLIFFAFSTYTAFSQDSSAWANMTLPANLSSDITAFSQSGNEVYLGTNGQGVFSSNDGGNTWINNSNAAIMGDGINGILIGLNKTYITGKNAVYMTSDNGSSWNEISTFPKDDGSIQCAALSIGGNLAIGTPASVWYYSENVDGWFWYKLNIQYGPMDVRAMKFNQNEQLFLTCIHRQSPEIYLVDPKGQMTFLEIVKDIRESPLASFFDMNANGVMFCSVGKSFYQFEYASNLWTLFTESPQKNVRRFKFAGNGNLLSFDDLNLRIFDPKGNQWLPDSPILNFDDSVIDAIIDASDVVKIIRKRAILISIGPVDKIISFIFSKYFIVKDAQGALMRHKTFVLYKASCDNNQSGLGTITTNYSGGFYLNYNYYSLHTGDQIKLEKLVYTEYAVKTGHSQMGNKMYDVYLNNMKYDGVGNPHYYSLTDDNTQTIFMDHSCIHRFLVFSVEWEAKRAYMDTVASWSRLMSNFLWDVTDGQLYVERVDIFDNYQRWYQADMRFYANNLVWPNSAVNGVYSIDSRGDQVRMPRRWLGNTDGTRNWSARNDWFTYDDRSLQLFMSSTMAHELGHYMFSFYDEYVWVDTNKAKLLPAGYNMGFMQYQYQNAPDWSSEMSDPDRYSNPNYRYTAQWAYNGSDCWTQFRNKYQGYYADPDGGDDIWVPIVFPKDRSLSGGLGFLRGPADYLYNQTQCNVISNTETNVYDQYFSAGDFKFTIVDEHGNPMAKADVTDMVPFFSTYLVKTQQGESADNGKMTVVGANVNDVIFISAKRELDFGIIKVPWFYFYAVTVTAVTGAKDNDDQIQDEQIIQIFPVKSDNRLVNSMKYDFSGNISLDLFTNKKFSSNPSIDIMLKDSTVKNYNLIFNAQKTVYSTQITEAVPDEGTFLFNTKDSADKPFSIFFNYRISDFGKNVLAPGGVAEIVLDTKNSEIERISALSSDFFPLKNGISASAKQAGFLVSFSSAPGQLSQGTINILNIRYSKTELTTEDELSLSIFKWDEDNLVWNKMPGNVDTTNGIVSTQISSMGTYAAFTTNNTVGVNDYDIGSFSLGAYPNPFTNSAKVDFFMPTAGFVSLKMYNALGDEVMTLANSNLEYGKHVYNLDGSQLPSGVYYLTMKANNQTITKKIVLVK